MSKHNFPIFTNDEVEKVASMGAMLAGGLLTAGGGALASKALPAMGKEIVRKAGGGGFLPSTGATGSLIDRAAMWGASRLGTKEFGRHNITPEIFKDVSSRVRVTPAHAKEISNFSKAFERASVAGDKKALTEFQKLTGNVGDIKNKAWQTNPEVARFMTEVPTGLPGRANKTIGNLLGAVKATDRGYVENQALSTMNKARKAAGMPDVTMVEVAGNSKLQGSFDRWVKHQQGEQLARGAKSAIGLGAVGLGAHAGAKAVKRVAPSYIDKLKADYGSPKEKKRQSIKLSLETTPQEG